MRHLRPLDRGQARVEVALNSGAIAIEQRPAGSAENPLRELHRIIALVQPIGSESWIELPQLARYDVTR
jgi:hypothetical protein